MEVGKTAVGDRNVGSLQVDMSVDLSSLAGETGTSPRRDISAHVWPTITGTQQPAGRTDSGMIDSMKVSKHLLSEVGGNMRAENTGRNVPK